MAWAYKAGVTSYDSDTGAIDTTGADLIVMMVGSRWAAENAPGDSAANEWHLAHARVGYDDGINGALYYANAPSVSASHTFHVHEAASAYYRILVAAFSGSDLGLHDAAEAAFINPAASAASPGSITPAENGELLVTGVIQQASLTAASLAIDTGFTIREHTESDTPGGIANLVQVTAAAINPAWTWTTDRRAIAVIASFKAAAASGAADRGMPRGMSGGMSSFSGGMLGYRKASRSHIFVPELPRGMGWKRGLIRGLSGGMS
jgi:hypothetical protein